MKKILSIESATVIRKKVKLLENISWEFEPGQHWAIIGRNGSGKTLTLQMINGYLWPTKGRVTVLDNVYGECNIPEVRKKIAWLSHSLQFQMMQALLAKDIVYSGFFSSIGLYEQPTKDQIEKAKVVAVKLSCDKLLDRNYDTLSCGEQKKILIARALVSDPELLILDEPCAGLDIKSREEFLNWLNEIVKSSKKTNVIFVSHHLEEIMPFVTHCLLMKDGEVIKQGKKEDILTKDVLSQCLDLGEVKLNRANSRYYLTIVNPLGM